MYVLLLWMRYLRTRYLAMVCVVSVMLGVATLIVVNSVMSGFSTKLQDRLKSLESDIMIESTDPLAGFPMTTDAMMKRIADSPVGNDIKAMSPSVELFALMRFNYRGRNYTQRVRLVGVDPKLHGELGGWSEYLQEPERSASPSFEIGKDAMKRYDAMHPDLPPDTLFPTPMDPPGKKINQLELPKIDPNQQAEKELKDVKDLPPIAPPPSQPRKPRGIIVGHALASYRDPKTEKTVYVLDRGDSVMVYTVGEALEPVYDEYTVIDYIKSELSDFDANTVYVPLDHLQKLRTSEGRVNSLQIRLKDPKKGEHVKLALEMLFPREDYRVETWKDKQKVLLAAIDVERGILNLLLFLIVGVAGFGILAIFSMIVREKTRDIGIMKSLGASGVGVLKIFLGYGTLLGVVGAMMGTGLGLLITKYINQIEAVISRISGRELFPRGVYYFDKIPTNIEISSIVAVDAGAILIAVVFSIWPAWRASGMHPVNALRYE
jgi:lipoprotein-releasing system permease protein